MTLFSRLPLNNLVIGQGRVFLINAYRSLLTPKNTQKIAENTAFFENSDNDRKDYYMHSCKERVLEIL